MGSSLINYIFKNKYDLKIQGCRSNEKKIILIFIKNKKKF